MNADGSEPLNLTPEPGRRTAILPGRPTGAGSPSSADNSEIYVMNADGSGQRRLARHAARYFAPAWSPDGRKLAFVSDRDGPFGSNAGDLRRERRRQRAAEPDPQPRVRQRPRLVARRTEDRLRAQLRDLRHERRRQRANEPNPQPCARLRPCLVTRRAADRLRAPARHDDSTALAPAAVERRSSRCTS